MTDIPAERAGLSFGSVLAIIAFMGGVGAGMAFPILPALGTELGLSGLLVGLILSANRVARLIFNLVAGSIFARIGVRRLLTMALLVETAGMVLMAMAIVLPGPAIWLLAGRFVYGVGMAFLLVGSQAAAIAAAGPGNRGRGTAALRMAITGAVPVGLVAGGLMADFWSDMAAFLSGGVITAIGAVMAGWMLRDAPAPAVADTKGQKVGFRSLLEVQQKTPMVVAWVLNFVVYLTVQGGFLASAVLLASDRGLTLPGLDARGSSGVFMALVMGSAALAARPTGRLVDSRARRSDVLMPALIGLAVGFGLVALAHDMALLILGLLVLGMSLNGATLPMMAMLGDATDARQQGPAVSLFQWVGDLGGTFGPMMGVEIAQRAGLGTLYWVMAAAVIPGLLGAVWLRRTETRTTIRI